LNEDLDNYDNLFGYLQKVQAVQSSSREIAKVKTKGSDDRHFILI